MRINVFLNKLKYLFLSMFILYSIGHYYSVNLGEKYYYNVDVYKIIDRTNIFGRVRYVETSVGDFDFITKDNKTWSDLLNEAEMQEGVNCMVITHGLRSKFFNTRPYIVKIRCKIK